MANELAALLGVDDGSSVDPTTDQIVRTVYGEAADQPPEGQQGVAAVIRNRQKSTGLPLDQILTPADFQAWGNPKLTARMKALTPESADYQKILSTIQPVLNGDADPTNGADHYYNPKTVPKPAWDNGTGQDIGAHRFLKIGYTPPGSTGSELSDLLGLPPTSHAMANAGLPVASTKPDEDQAALAKWSGQVPPTDPATEPGKQPGDPRIIRYPTGEPVTKAQEAWYQTNAAGIKQDVPGLAGRPEDPYFIPPGGDAPTAPNVVWIDADGVKHVNRGGIGATLSSLGAGLLQAPVQAMASVNKLTGGALAVPQEGFFDPNGPDPLEAMKGSQDAFARQDQQYQHVHANDLPAQVGNTAGQLALGTGASLAVPEIELPGAAMAGAKGLSGLIGNTSKIGGNLLTNAGRGVAATVPGLSTSNVPVGEQLAAGGVAGMVLPPALEATGKAGARLLSGGNPVPVSIASLADTAMNKYGIPLRSSQIAGTMDRNAAVRDSQLISAPGSGFAKNNAAQKTAFAKAVTKTFGEDADALTPDVMQSARTRIGSVFDSVAKNTTITDTDTLLTKLGSVVKDAQQALPENEVTPLLKQVEAIGSTIEDGKLTGESYQALTRKGAPLERAQNSANPNLRYYAGQIRDALDDSLEASASPEDLKALQTARWQYKNLMTVKDLAAKAGVTGEISPLLLNGAVGKSFKNRAFAGAGDLGELSQIGQAFMKEPPNSGTPSRFAEMLKGAVAGGAVTGEGALVALNHPELAFQLAAAAAAAGGLRYGSNALRGTLNNNPITTAALLRSANPGGVANAVPNFLTGVGNFVQPAQVPASAFIANRFLNPPPAVGANP